MKLILARDHEQGELHAQALGQDRTPRIVATHRGCLPPGVYPLPEDVSYSPGWELGRNASRILVELQRAYRKRVAA